VAARSGGRRYIVDPLVKSKKVPLERYNVLLSNTYLGREERYE